MPCQFRMPDGAMCREPDYGNFTINVDNAYGTFECCKEHFNEYLNDPADFLERFQRGVDVLLES